MFRKKINKKNWYVLYTKRNHEKKVVESLGKLGITAYCPMYETVRQWSDRKKKIKVPFINSCVFVNIEEANRDRVFNIIGVVKYLFYLGKAAIVREHEIENFRILEANSLNIKQIEKINLNEGDEVEVKSGPFEGLIATVISGSGKQRIIVNVEALNSYMEVTMPISHVVAC